MLNWRADTIVSLFKKSEMSLFGLWAVIVGSLLLSSCLQLPVRTGIYTLAGLFPPPPRALFETPSLELVDNWFDSFDRFLQRQSDLKRSKIRDIDIRHPTSDMRWRYCVTDDHND